MAQEYAHTNSLLTRKAPKLGYECIPVMYFWKRWWVYYEMKIYVVLNPKPRPKLGLWNFKGSTINSFQNVLQIRICYNVDQCKINDYIWTMFSIPSLKFQIIYWCSYRSALIVYAGTHVEAFNLEFWSQIEEVISFGALEYVKHS